MGFSWGAVDWPGRVRKARPGFPADLRRAFTLLELLLVLALLAMAVAVAAPSLSRFFAGRSLDSEGRRMVALTRYAQSRAVSEGIPMVMWFNPQLGTYGVEAEQTYPGVDTKAVTYELESNLKMELPANSDPQATPWKATAEIGGANPAIRFTPDGFISDTSPKWIWLRLTRDDQPDAVWLALNDNGLNYELQNNQPTAR
jgi:prepilin-type N-terminal cleavage/methylation domain-containing protein